jgi:hypothetical protein
MSKKYNMTHRSPQRFFVADGTTLYGTQSLKGMTEGAASKRAALYNVLYKTKRFRVSEVLPCPQPAGEKDAIAIS